MPKGGFWYWGVTPAFGFEPANKGLGRRLQPEWTIAQFKKLAINPYENLLCLMPMDMLWTPTELYLMPKYMGENMVLLRCKVWEFSWRKLLLFGLNILQSISVYKGENMVLYKMVCVRVFLTEIIAIWAKYHNNIRRGKIWYFLKW